MIVCLNYNNNYQNIDYAIKNLPIEEWDDFKVSHICRYILQNNKEIKESAALTSKALSFLENPDLNGPDHFQSLSTNTRTLLLIVHDVLRNDTSLTDRFFVLYKEWDFEKVKCLLNKKLVDVDARYPGGATVLHIACATGQLDMVKYLIHLPGIDVNARDERHNTPLHIACMMGQFEIIRCLNVSGKADINAKDSDGMTPLHLVCRKPDHLGYVRYLIEIADADVNVKNVKGATPLHCACENKDIKIVQYLMENTNADPTVKLLTDRSVFDLIIANEDEAKLAYFKDRYISIIDRMALDWHNGDLTLEKYLNVIQKFERFFSAINRENHFYFAHKIPLLLLPFLSKSDEYKQLIEQRIVEIEKLSQFEERLALAKRFRSQLMSLRVLFNFDSQYHRLVSDLGKFLNDQIMQLVALVEHSESKLKPSGYQAEFERYKKDISFTLLGSLNIGVAVQGSTGEEGELNARHSDTYERLLGKPQSAIGQFGIDCGEDLIAIGIDPEIGYYVDQYRDNLGKRDCVEIALSLKRAIEKKLNELQEIADKIPREYSMLQTFHAELEQAKGLVDEDFLRRLKSADVDLKIALLKAFLAQNASAVEAHLDKTADSQISQVKASEGLTLKQLFTDDFRIAGDQGKHFDDGGRPV